LSSIIFLFILLPLERGKRGERPRIGLFRGAAGKLLARGNIL